MKRLLASLLIALPLLTFGQLISKNQRLSISGSLLSSKPISPIISNVKTMWVRSENSPYFTFNSTIDYTLQLAYTFRVGKHSAISSGIILGTQTYNITFQKQEKQAISIKNRNVNIMVPLTYNYIIPIGNKYEVVPKIGFSYTRNFEGVRSKVAVNQRISASFEESYNKQFLYNCDAIYGVTVNRYLKNNNLLAFNFWFNGRDLSPYLYDDYSKEIAKRDKYYNWVSANVTDINLNKEIGYAKMGMPSSLAGFNFSIGYTFNGKRKPNTKAPIL